MDYPIKVTLSRPITVKDQEHKALAFDEPDLGTVIAVEEAETAGEQTILLLAGMADVDVAVIKKIKERDFETINREVLKPYREANSGKEAGADVGNEPAA